MTKFRWNDPPNERDPANYDPDRDPKLMFTGRKYRHSITERQTILNRIIEIDDLIITYEAEVEPYAPDPSFLMGDDLKRYEELNNFDPSFSSTGGRGALIAREVSRLKAERLELIESLAAFPRTDRF